MPIPNVMISYNRNSSASLALKLNEKLKFIGIKTWIDSENNNNNLFSSSIVNAIETSDVIIVILSNEYCQNKNSIRECEYALNRKKYVIIVKDNFIPSGDPIDSLTSSLEYINIDSSKTDIDSEFTLLLKKIIRYENLNDYDYGIMLSINMFNKLTFYLFFRSPAFEFRISYFVFIQLFIIFRLQLIIRFGVWYIGPIKCI